MDEEAAATTTPTITAPRSTTHQCQYVLLPYSHTHAHFNGFRTTENGTSISRLSNKITANIPWRMEGSRSAAPTHLLNNKTFQYLYFAWFVFYRCAHRAHCLGVTQSYYSAQRRFPSFFRIYIWRSLIFFYVLAGEKKNKLSWWSSVLSLPSAINRHWNTNATHTHTAVVYALAIRTQCIVSIFVVILLLPSGCRAVPSFI